MDKRVIYYYFIYLLFIYIYYYYYYYYHIQDPLLVHDCNPLDLPLQNQTLLKGYLLNPTHQITFGN